jgi:hypothetical protein
MRIDDANARFETRAPHGDELVDAPRVEAGQGCAQRGLSPDRAVHPID